MKVASFMRRSHRWACVVFFVVFVANVGANLLLDESQQALTMAIGFSALPPLFYLMGTGLYLFVQPYLRKTAA